jgi:AAA-like domain
VGRDVAFMIPAGVMRSHLGIEDAVSEVAGAIELEEPGGRMRNDSPFYVLRSPAEETALREILKPGALIRIKAPHEYGKSSLMGRVVVQAGAARTVSINFREIDREFLGSLKEFLPHFCVRVTRKLGFENRLKDYWGCGLGAKGDCGEYFEDYLLPQIAEALVLELDEVDVLLEGAGDRTWVVDFLAMLRAWFEKGRVHGQWRKLRLILVHSKDIDQETLQQSQSPFNVGTEIPLEEFSVAQVEDLATRYRLGADVAVGLMDWVGGHPQLVRVGLDAIARRQVTLAQLQEGTLYQSHLQQMQRRLEQKDGKVKEALRRVLANPEGATIELAEQSVLRSLGLVRLQGYQVRITCELYRQYFSRVLGV